MTGHSKWADIQHRVGTRRPGGRAGGAGAGPAFRAARYEGYGPGGAAVMIDCLTDDRDRTVAALREAFASHGGHLGADGSVAYLFQQAGVLAFPPGCDEDAVMDIALDAGAEDVVVNADGSLDVLTAPADLEAVRAALARRGLVAASGEVTQRAATNAVLAGDAAATLVGLLTALEGLDDVQHVYSNAEIADDVLARLPA
ncbi:MAG: YebC/PmpR family DNA-binding transcriptional regulator [Steroidobacteraceae bacterium]